MLKHISLSDVVVSHVFVSSRFGFRLVVVRVVGFDPRCDPARPGPVQSGLRAPGAPAPCAPPPPGLFLSFDFSRAVTSLSHLSLSLPVVP
jgi:hypothetical protein